MLLLHESLGGWHPLPLACNGCSRILPDLDSFGTKSSVLTVGFDPWGPQPLADSCADACVGVCVKQAFCIFK